MKGSRWVGELAVGAVSASACFRHVLHGLLLASLASLTACTTPVHAPHQHVVLVNHDGQSLYTDLDGDCYRDKPRFLSPESADDFKRHLAAITNAVATCTNCLGPDGTRRILIFVHGGLNTYQQSLARVNETMQEASATNFFPLFINWDSGLISSYFEHLLWVRQGTVQRVWGPVTSPLYLLADLGRTLTRAPVAWYYQLTSDLTTTARYESPNFSRRAKLQALARHSPSDHQPFLSIGSDERTGASKLGYAASYAVTLPFKLVTGPLIDGLGKSAWDNMSRRTQTMFRFPEQFERPNATNELTIARHQTGQAAQGAVAQLMRSLHDLITNSPPDRYSITLIGHSMGTIVANEIVRTQPDLPYADIVYMGAACSVSDFEKSVVPYLERATNAHFYNLTLHPVAEAREAQWSLLDITPRGSLLEWIDNFLSTPRTVPERTLGNWDNVISTTALVPRDVARRARIRAFAVGPKDKLPPRTPLVHGQFSEEPFWEETFWTELQP